MLPAFIVAWFAALKAEFKELYVDASMVRDGHLTVHQAAARGSDRGQLGTQTVVAAFILVIIGMAVVIALDKFDDSIGTPSNNDLSNSSDSLLSGFSSMVDLIEPLLLIAIIVVLIALVRRIQ